MLAALARRLHKYVMRNSAESLPLKEGRPEMKHLSFHYSELSDKQIIPLELLLQADPSETQVRGYLPQSRVLAVVRENAVLGVCCLLSIAADTVEVVNLSVAVAFQGRGIGRSLLQFAIETCRAGGLVKRMRICTGNSSIGQIALYLSLIHI